MENTDYALIKFDGKQCATTSCGYSGKVPAVNAFLQAYRGEASLAPYLKNAAHEVDHATLQQIAAAEGFVNSAAKGK